MKNKLFKDQFLILGTVLLFISLTIRYIADLNILNTDADSIGPFFLQYGFAIFYYIYTAVGNKIRNRNIAEGENKTKLSKYFPLMLLLFFTSCFGLNKGMCVFQDSVMWLQIYLSIGGLALLMHVYKEFIPTKYHWFIVLTISLSVPIYFYLAFMLIPLYIFSILGLILLGISIHSYIPLAMLIYCGFALKYHLKNNPKYFSIMITGIVLPVVATIIYCILWAQKVDDIKKLQHDTLLESKTELPFWVYVTSKERYSYFFEKIIKGRLQFQTIKNDNFWLDFNSNFDKFDEGVKHDPLVLIADAFTNKLDLTDEERVNIISAYTNTTHYSEPRLWSGDMLQTKDIITNVEIFPKERLSYTERIITIENISRQTWRNDQEAIYTFQLPEGGFVTSLSLWVNRKERKSRLTTKSKAKKAYDTIVGVEVRDPSVVHWQEGNMISVRVFPCNRNEDRQFKLGITAPLLSIENQTVYQNISFKGPDFSKAKESVKIKFKDNVSNLSLPYHCENSDINTYKTELNKYNPDWNIKFTNTTNLNGFFSFNGYKYELLPLITKYEKFQPKIIYLDINKTWTQSELETIFDSYQGKVFKLANNQTNTVSKKDCEIILKNAPNYDLPPFYVFENNSLLITKSVDLGPRLNEISSSEFSKKTRDFFTSGHTISVLNINNKISPFYRSLRELGVIHYESIDLKTLKEIAPKDLYPSHPLSSNEVMIQDAKIKIRKTLSNETKSNNNNHIMRTFAYNDIMKKIGVKYFEKEYVEDSLVREAEEAFIVSPVSSLIVLETDDDYKDKDIDKNKNSLGNASVNKSGAVPEPHECLMILICCLLVIYVVNKNKYRVSKSAK